MPDHSFFTPAVLFTFAIPHTIFTVIFLFSKEERKLHDVIASIWIILLTIPIGLRFILSSMEPGSQASLFRNIVYPLSYGPMAYLYTRSLTEENPKLFLRDLFHWPKCYSWLRESPRSLRADPDRYPVIRLLIA